MRPTHYSYTCDYGKAYAPFNWTGRVRETTGGPNPRVEYEGRYTWFFGLFNGTWWALEDMLEVFPAEVTTEWNALETGED